MIPIHETLFPRNFLPPKISTESILLSNFFIPVGARKQISGKCKSGLTIAKCYITALTKGNRFLQLATPSAPPGCYHDKETNIFQYNDDQSSEVPCSEEKPCFCDGMLQRSTLTWFD